NTAFSVSNSTKGWSTATVSPTFTRTLVTSPEETFSEISGSLTSTIMGRDYTLGARRATGLRCPLARPAPRVPDDEERQQDVEAAEKEIERPRARHGHRDKDGVERSHHHIQPATRFGLQRDRQKNHQRRDRHRDGRGEQNPLRHVAERWHLSGQHLIELPR